VPLKEESGMRKWRRQGWPKTSKREITGVGAHKAQARRRVAHDVSKGDANTIPEREIPVKDKG